MQNLLPMEAFKCIVKVSESGTIKIPFRKIQLFDVKNVA